VRRRRRPYASQWDLKHITRAPETTERQQMRIKDIRQELHRLLHTQGLDGLLHLYNRLETGAASCCCACYLQRPDG
jgi:hypothetical protein